MHALVIDDSKATRRILSQILKKKGFEITEAEDGKDALERLKALGSADLATVDWNMPGMDGYEFVKAVRGDAAYDSLRLLMVTTETEITQVAKALDAGVNEYLMKPFTPEVVTEKLAIIGIGTEIHE